MLESDDILNRFVAEAGADKATLPTYQFFTGEATGDASMMTSFRKLFKYIMAKEGGYKEALAAMEAIEL